MAVLVSISSEVGGRGFLLKIQRDIHMFSGQMSAFSSLSTSTLKIHRRNVQRSCGMIPRRFCQSGRRGGTLL